MTVSRLKGLRDIETKRMNGRSSVLYHNQPPTRKAEQPTHNIKYNHNNFILFISPDFLLLPYIENLFFSVCNPIKLIFFAFIAEKNVI